MTESLGDALRRARESVADLAVRIGPVAADEFAAAPDHTKRRLLQWIDRLPTLTDAEFVDECKYAIFCSASVARFNGNFEDDHCKASACFHESRTRLIRDGHDRDCRGPTLYSRAHSAVMRDHGYAPTADGECRCDLQRPADELPPNVSVTR